MNKKTVKKGLLPYTLMFIFIVGCLFTLNMLNTKINKLTYDEFKQSMNNNEIETLTITPKTRTEVYEVVGTLKDYEKNEKSQLEQGAVCTDGSAFIHSQLQ